MKKKCPREEKVTKVTNPALFFETLAVNTTAAKREDLFSTKLFKVKYILLEVKIHTTIHTKLTLISRIYLYEILIFVY